MKTRSWRRAGSGAILSLTIASTAHGELDRVRDRLSGSGPGDGVYGRFDGDLSLSVGVGCAYDGVPEDLRIGASVSSEFYQSVGVYGSFWQSLPPSSAVPRAAELGVTLRPLFLLRWSTDRQSGYPFWDLLVDSISLSMGVTLAEPTGGELGVQNGLALGIGAGVPLALRAPGPWLRMRGGIHSAGPDVTGTVQLLLEWQWFFFAGWLD